MSTRLEAQHEEMDAPRSNSIGSKIRRIVWDSDNKSEVERKFVRKLDCALLTIAMLGYFVKYLSQANIANAYASGMKEALNFQGDQYNVLLTMFTVGYVIGTFPGTMMMVWLRPSIWLPSCEVVWTILVMCCAAAKNPQTLYGLRFVIGLLEATAYPGMIWVLGNWYGPAELSKRVVMFQATSSVGTMFSGYLQAAVHADHGRCHLLAHLHSRLLPHPGLADNINPRSRWLFKDEDIDMAIARAQKWKRAPRKGLTVKAFKDTFSTWWAFAIPYVAFVVGLGSYQYMNLWLAATPPWRGNITLINVIPTGGYAISICASLIYSWVSDGTGMRWQIMVFGGIPPLIGNIILSTWPEANSTKFVGFFLNFTATPIGAIMLAWANELLSDSAEARAITIGFQNTAAYAVNAWAPNLIFPASQAPIYRAGYKVTACLFGVWICGIMVIIYLYKNAPVTKWKKQREADEASAHSDENDEKKGVDETATGLGGIADLGRIEGAATRQP
ncbi:MFS general substrate transporter [Dioszegia hungarica]|uniref:MFS general substrate transporter n=1 Tax=Dioszegia hungarica TaxID=4972 RepID=A0AA38H117_9TREE|nr:MFS general substrate transporter [Dioszegia hungarica]KAI9631777.1 MFS general substrate transporter [Dioszegia hungarica]